MSAELEQLTAYGNELVTELRERIKSFPATRFGPVNASGKLADSIQMEVTELPKGYRLTLYGASYALTLEYGRKPGKFPPLKSIQQWIEDKNIVPHPDAHGKAPSIVAGKNGYSSLAFLIGRKIANSGTTIYQAGQPSLLFGALLEPTQVAAAVKSIIIPLLVTQITSSLRQAITA